MSVAASIANRIKHMPKGKPFSIERFAQEGSRASVEKAISRLVMAGVLERVFRGVYMRPKVSRFVGRIKPSATAIMEVVTKANGEKVQLHGAEAARLLNLSTQMQMVPTYYTSGPTREIRVGESLARLRHVSPDRLQHAGTKVGLALTALYYLGKEEATKDVVSKILATLTEEETKKLIACRMPAWMRSALIAGSTGEKSGRLVLRSKAKRASRNNSSRRSVETTRRQSRSRD